MNNENRIVNKTNLKVSKVMKEKNTKVSEELKDKF